MSQATFHSTAPPTVKTISGSFKRDGRDSNPSSENKTYPFGYIYDTLLDSQLLRSQNAPGATPALGKRQTPEGGMDASSPQRNVGEMGISPCPIFFEPRQNNAVGGLICGLEDEARYTDLKSMLASFLEGKANESERVSASVLCYTAEYGSLKLAETLSTLQREGRVSQRPKLIVLVPDPNEARSLYDKQELDDVDLRVLPLRVHWEDIELEHLWHICGDQDSSIVVPGDQWSPQVREHKANPGAIRALLQLIENNEPRLTTAAACIQNLCTMFSAPIPETRGNKPTEFARPIEWLRWIVGGGPETPHHASQIASEPSNGHSDVTGDFVLCIDFANYLPGQEKVVNVLADVILRSWLRCQPPRSGAQLIVCDKPDLYLSPGPFDRSLVQLLSSSACSDQSPHTGRSNHGSTNVVISTKSPNVVSASLLDHLSYLLLHRFTAPHWLHKLQDHFWLPESLMSRILELTRKESLLFVPPLARLPFKMHDQSRPLSGLLRLRLYTVDETTDEANLSKTFYQSQITQVASRSTVRRAINTPPCDHGLGLKATYQQSTSIPSNSTIPSSSQAWSTPVPSTTLSRPSSPTVTGSAALGGEQISEGYRRSAFAGVIGKGARLAGGNVHTPVNNPMASPFLSSPTANGLARSPVRPSLTTPDNRSFGILSPTGTSSLRPFSPFHPSSNLGEESAISPGSQWLDYTTRNLHAPASHSLKFRVPSEEQSSNGQESHDGSSFDYLEGGATSGGESSWTKFSTSSVSVSKPSSGSPQVFEPSLHAAVTGERGETGSYGLAGLGLKGRSYAGVVAPHSSKSAPNSGYSTYDHPIRDGLSLHDSIGSNSTIEHISRTHTYTPAASQDNSSNEPPPNYPVSFFWPLLDALEKARAQVSTPHNRAQSVRHSVVGQELPPSARARLGLTFKEYVAAASRAGVIVTGDSGDKAWIAMKDWKYPGKNTGGHALPSASVAGGVRIASK